MIKLTSSQADVIKNMIRAAFIIWGEKPIEAFPKFTFDSAVALSDDLAARVAAWDFLPIEVALIQTIEGWPAQTPPGTRPSTYQRALKIIGAEPHASEERAREALFALLSFRGFDAQTAADEAVAEAFEPEPPGPAGDAPEAYEAPPPSEAPSGPRPPPLFRLTTSVRAVDIVPGIVAVAGPMGLSEAEIVDVADHASRTHKIAVGPPEVKDAISACLDLGLLQTDAPGFRPSAALGLDLGLSICRSLADLGIRATPSADGSSLGIEGHGPMRHETIAALISLALRGKAGGSFGPVPVAGGLARATLASMAPGESRAVGGQIVRRVASAELGNGAPLFVLGSGDHETNALTLDEAAKEIAA